jgi:PhnB protein
MTDVKTTIIPHLSCRNATEAVEFYQKAFGAEVVRLYKLPDGKLMHASLNIRGADFYVVDEFPEMGGKSPLLLGGSPVTLHQQVPDCDAVYQRAVEAGCTIGMPLQDMFWGDRWGTITDPYGHVWSIATTIREVTDAEMEEAMKNMPTECPETAEK